MDRRSLIWIFLFTMMFIGVQMYFENQNQDELRKLNDQRVAKATIKRKKIEEDIVTRTAKPEELPLLKLYSDTNLTTLFTNGVRSGNGIIILADNPPSTLYSTDKTTYSKKFSSETSPAFSVYTKDRNALLTIGQLNYFGNFELQLVSANDKVQLGEYVDGIFTLPAKQLQEVYFQLGESNDLPPLGKLPESNAIVLMKSEKGYLPVGIYDAHSKNFLNFQTLEGLDAFAELAPFKKSEKFESAQEKFYVLENEFQQLVFSTKGGALVEINLPIKDDAHKNSIVLPIETDKEMIEKYPANDRFPAHPYTSFTDGKQVEHASGRLGGYYPLIRRDFIAPAKKLSKNVTPQYYATNIVSDYPEVAELNYKVKEFTNDKIVLEAQQAFRKITKTYKLDSAQAPYTFTLDIQIDGDSRSLWLTSGVPEVEMISGSPAPALKYRITRGTSSEVKQLDLPQEAATFSQVQPDWIVNSNGFFGIILDPTSQQEGGFRIQKVSGETVPSRLVDLGVGAATIPGYMVMVPLQTKGGKYSFRLFAGPFATELLKSVDAHYADTATGYNPDYIASQTFHGWFGFISDPFAKFLFFLMNIFHKLTNSWGLSIILLTVALRIMLYPLNAWSMRSSTQMQQIMPEIQAIQEKYKKDPKKSQEEVIKLYREKKINPLSGCLPLLIQIPFLIGMFDLLKSAFELRGASFIPGWIDNLSAPDVLFSWTTPLPFIGNQFHLLPILTGLVMFFQQRWMTASPKDPSQLTEKERQQKAMGSIFAVMFTFMFYNFPSGINIYWISTSLLGILQQWWTKRKLAAEANKPVVLQGNSNKR